MPDRSIQSPRARQESATPGASAKGAPFLAALLSRLVLAVALVVASGCSPTRGIEAVGLLFDLARPDAPASVPVERATITYEGAEGPRRAHLYRPGDTEAALVLVPGAAEQAMEDPRLVNLADALRRRDFLVLVPELAGEDPLQVSAEDAGAVSAAVRHLLASESPDTVGLAALSYAAGPTIQAALREDIREEIDFIVAVGGYHDIVSAITYLTTGAFRADPREPWRHAEIDRRARWIFLRANAGRASHPADVERLGAIARARLARPGAVVDALVDELGPEGRAIFDLVANKQPERVPQLIRALPERLREEIEALDLSTLDLSRLEADLLLVHGRNDALVPYTESVSLARAVGPEQSTIYLLRDLQHVDLGTPGIADLRTLLQAVYRVLSFRDAARP